MHGDDGGLARTKSGTSLLPQLNDSGLGLEFGSQSVMCDDGGICYLQPDFVAGCELLTEMAKDLDSTSECIPLPALSRDALSVAVFAFASMSCGERNDLNRITIDSLIACLNTADFLGHTTLTKFCASHLAEILKGKSSMEMRDILHMPDDLPACHVLQIGDVFEQPSSLAIKSLQENLFSVAVADRMDSISRMNDPCIFLEEMDLVDIPVFAQSSRVACELLFGPLQGEKNIFKHWKSALAKRHASLNSDMFDTLPKNIESVTSILVATYSPLALINEIALCKSNGSIGPTTIARISSRVQDRLGVLIGFRSVSLLKDMSQLSLWQEIVYSMCVVRQKEGRESMLLVANALVRKLIDQGVSSVGTLHGVEKVSAPTLGAQSNSKLPAELVTELDQRWVHLQSTGRALCTTFSYSDAHRKDPDEISPRVLFEQHILTGWPQAVALGWQPSSSFDQPVDNKEFVVHFRCGGAPDSWTDEQRTVSTTFGTVRTCAQISPMLELASTNLTIHLESCTVAGVATTIDYLTNIANVEGPEARQNLLEAFKQSLGGQERLPHLFQTMTTANRMGEATLLDELCKMVADLIAQRTPNEILDYFNIKNDATWEEEQELIATHSWIDPEGLIARDRELRLAEQARERGGPPNRRREQEENGVEYENGA
eukprot:SAG11_NODE_3267_length_2568_cov_1.661401_1_plen_659_part_00